jgi:soluble lytic murein transglycosylase
LTKNNEEELVEKAKRVVWRLLAASVCVMAVSQAVHADSLDEQRNRYAQIKQAWDNKQMDTVQALMPTLKDYPLYPYLEYRQITDDLMNQPTVTVNNFIQANPTLPPARNLKSRFVNELARREDWRGLLAFSPEKPNTTEAQCNYYYANGRPASRKRPGPGRKSCG